MGEHHITRRTLRYALIASVITATLTMTTAGAATATPPITGQPVVTATTSEAPLATATTAAKDWAYPLKTKTYRVSSTYGARCIPVRGGSTMHLGEDLAAPNNAKIYAIADGVVKYTINGTNTRAGYIGVEHKVGKRTYFSVYVHVWNAKKYVKVGDTVTAGQKIGLVGSSGASTAPHLHLEIWRDKFHGTGTAVNPVTFLKDRGIDLRANATAVSSVKKPKSCTYYTPLYVALRTSPSATAKATTTLVPNAVLTHTPGQASNGFIPVTVKGKTGWVAIGSVQPTKAAVPRATTKVRYYSAAKKVALRSKASSTSAKKRTLASGTRMKLISVKKNGWAKVTVSGTTGWLPPKTVRLIDKRHRITTPTTMRTTAWANGKAVTNLAKKKTISPITSEHGWTYITVGGNKGWVPSTHVTYVSVNRIVN